MFESHGSALVASYAAALLGFLALRRGFPRTWPQPAPAAIEHPWRATGVLLLSIAGVLAVGQAYQRGFALPERGAYAPLAGALNQLLIFSPALLTLALRRESARTVWLGGTSIGGRLLAGAALALLAVLTYSLVRAGSDSISGLLARIAVPAHLDEAVQVFLEDVLIAALFVRMAAALRSETLTIGLVALLFAAGHVPALLTKGSQPSELLWLLRDVGLGVVVIALLARSRDILWFFPVHFALDMTQFESVVFTP